jgi:hypothetical protein
MLSIPSLSPDSREAKLCEQMMGSEIRHTLSLML